MHVHIHCCAHSLDTRSIHIHLSTITCTQLMKLLPISQFSCKLVPSSVKLDIVPFRTPLPEYVFTYTARKGKTHGCKQYVFHPHRILYLPVTLTHVPYLSCCAMHKNFIPFTFAVLQQYHILC